MQRDAVDKYPLPAAQGEATDLDSKIVPLSDVMTTDALIKSDLEHTGLERIRLWTKEALLDRADAWGFALKTSSADPDAVQGWILIRSCQSGLRFGPLYATSHEVAARLLHVALEQSKGKPGSIVAEVWMGNKNAQSVFLQAGFSGLGVDYHRMWLNGRVPAEQDKDGLAETNVFAMFDAGEG